MSALGRLRRRPVVGARSGIVVGDKKATNVGTDVGIGVILSMLRVGYSLWWGYDPGQTGYQVEEVVAMGGLSTSRERLARDGLSRVFVERTRVRLPRCRLSQGEEVKPVGLRRLEGIRLGVFMVTDLRSLYVLFEVLLIPIYRLIGVWGSRERKVRASYRLVRYTRAGSVGRLVGLVCAGAEIGSLDRRVLAEDRGDEGGINGMWLGLFRAFAVKVPIVPIHGWLPEAHVEATTSGSVVLAGLLLKVGTYGLVRVIRQVLPRETEYWSPRGYSRACLGLVYTGRTARRQLDRKRVIAYSSIAHMNLMVLGRLRQDGVGRLGSLRQMVSHGLVSAGLFRLVGVRYDRYHTRLVGYYGGLGTTIPRYSMRRRSFALANIGRPGTSAFVGEWLIRVGLSEASDRLLVVASGSLIRTGTYTLWAYNRVVYGNRKRAYRTGTPAEGEGSIVTIGDRYCLEARVLRPRWLGVWLLGLHPVVVRDRLIQQ